MATNRNQAIAGKSELGSIFGFDWILGTHLFPLIKKLGNTLVYEDKKILVDIGCGDSPYKNILAGAVKYYYGVDLKRAKVYPEIYADALNLPFKDMSVDVCLNIWLLDDLSDPEKYFDQTYRILKQNGLLVMAETLIFPEHDAPHDYFRFTRIGLRHYAEAAGFKTESIVPLGGFWSQIGIQMTSFLLRGVSGYCSWIARGIAPICNLLFISLDKANYIPRGSFAHFALFRKS